ncbi:MAG: RNA methyltransferase [Phycisphaeraceae bacterium]|nr:RNA methyltransferase [Phycisphaeraceae bacterium]
MIRIPVSSIDDPRIADYANIRDAELMQRRDPLDARAHRGLFIAEGELVVRRLVGSGFPTRSLFTVDRHADKLADLAPLLPHDTPLYVAPQDVLNGVVGFNIHRGVLAVGLRTPPPTLAGLLDRSGPFLILEDLCNHDNLGGIFRNAAALGGTGSAVLLSARCADPLYRKSLRVSMGNTLAVPFARLDDWPAPAGADASAIRSAGIQTWALTPAPDATDIADAVAELRPDARVAMLLGSEGPGISEEAMRTADRRVRIAMNRASPSVDSLNVAVAAAIALHELAKRSTV